MQSRFMKNDVNPTILVLASSKRTEQSYMETFIESKKKNESNTTLVIDEPQWVIRSDKNTNRKFNVAVGNKFLSSEVIPLDATENDLSIYRDRGYNIIQVPMGYYENFIDDIDVALTDIAGISTSSSSRYISGPRLAEVKHPELHNPFTKEIIEVGNGPEDTTQYSDFFNLENVNKDMMEKPLFVHLDMSISGNKTGIAGVWIKGIKTPEEGKPDNHELVYELAFSVSIKAPKGYQISFEKNRQFIYWLRDNGFNVKGVSCDTFQSYDLLQQLSAHNFNTQIISVDKVTDKICKPYQYFKSVIYENRIRMYENKLLTEEIIGLERNNNSGKVDHAPTGINCFTGDTKIRLLDGRSVSILDLKDEFESGKTNYVYSFNHTTKKIEPKPISNVFCSGKNACLVEVILNNGEVIRCTPEHKFMLRDGSYIEAQYLQQNDSLMPLYTKVSNKGLNGYRLFYEPMEDIWHYEHRRFCVEVDDERYLVHHKDCNKLNNNPSNLVWCSKGRHQTIHSELQTGAQSPEANKKRSQSVTNWYNTVEKDIKYWQRWYPNITTEEELGQLLKNKQLIKDKKCQRAEIRREKHIKNQEKVQSQKIKQHDMAKYYDIDLDKLEGTQLQSLMIKYAHDIDPSYQERVSAAVSENHKLGKYNNAYLALQKCNDERKGKPRPKEVIDKMKATRIANGSYKVSDETRKKIGEAISKKRWFNNGIKNIYIDPETTEIPDGFTHGRLMTWKNHKVARVRVLDYTEDVYDITVEDNHNFALDAGVFVHNSKDQADAVCGALCNASNHAEEFDFEFGDRIDTMVDVSTEVSPEMQQKQLTIDFENELKKVQSDFSNSMSLPNVGEDYYFANDIIII